MLTLLSRGGERPHRAGAWKVGVVPAATPWWSSGRSATADRWECVGVTNVEDRIFIPRGVRAD
jgi:hypothetical protein